MIVRKLVGIHLIEESFELAKICIWKWYANSCINGCTKPKQHRLSWISSESHVIHSILIHYTAQSTWFIRMILITIQRTIKCAHNCQRKCRHRYNQVDWEPMMKKKKMRKKLEENWWRNFSSKLPESHARMFGISGFRCDRNLIVIYLAFIYLCLCHCDKSIPST